MSDSLLDRTAAMLASSGTGHLTLARAPGDAIIIDTDQGPVVVKLTERTNGAGMAFVVSGSKAIKVLRWEVAERMTEAA